MLFLQTSGTGPNLVLLHGFCENSTCFNEQVFLLKDFFSVTVIDLPGVGKSPYMENLSIEKMADAVHHTLQENGIQEMVMIGHSMGGYVTLSYAKKYEETLKGFGLLHSTANPDNEERKLKREQAMAVISEKGHEHYVRQFIPPLFAPGYANKAKLDFMVEEGLKTSRNAVLGQILSMKQRPSSREFIQETNLPVFFMAGKMDAIIPEKDMIEQAAMVKQGYINVLENSAHMGMIEEPDACATAIREFTTTCFA
ncbi:MAG: alpha/beta hydrolase [Bacteroidia bacterium]|jgi:pimeloyl-ACP methyl ester carboxylesterase